MKKLVLFAALAVFGFCYVFAQNVDLVDYQRGNETENFLSVNDDEFGNSSAEISSDTSSNLFLNNIQFGLSAGLVFSNIVGDEADSFDSRTSFTAGLMVLMPINEKWALQPELNYACLGADYEDVFEDEFGSRTMVEYTGAFKFHYLQLPVIAKYYIVDGVSLEAGPQVSFLVAAVDEYEILGEADDEDISDLANGVDFGLNAGVGYTFDPGIHIRARYMIGLSEVNNTDGEEGVPLGASWKNSAFQIAVGYFF